MPRCLVLDWDQDRCHLLVGNVTRSGVVIERALAWAQEEIFDLHQGEDAGRKLKDLLKNANLGPMPLLVCLPKQRILMKELRCPIVSADEEPALVRFQATKELLENPEDVVVDYAPLSRSSTESVILVTAVRRDILAGYNAMAKTAGLKLLAVTPRPFVLADLLDRCQKIDPVPSATRPEWSAVLLLGESWAELTILHKRTVCFARFMVNDDTVAGEVRRSLAMFGSQAQGHTPQIVYLFGKGATTPLQEQFAAALHLPVTRPAVLGKDDKAAEGGDSDSPAGIGLLAAWCDEKLPVNFVKPKEPKPPAPTNHRLWVLAAGLGVVLLAFFMLVTQQTLAAMKTRIADAKQQKEDMEKKFKSPEFEQARLDIDAFEEWEQGSIPWVDEVYELAYRFPWRPVGFHLNKLDGNVPNRQNPKIKDKYQAKVVLTGVESADGQRQKFQAILRDDHLQVRPDASSGNRFSIILDLARQPVGKYTAVLEPPIKMDKK